MTVLVSASRLIPGAVVCGARGLGVKGSTIPSSGGDGPSPVYPSLSLPADANKEYRVVLVAQPSFGTMSIGENTGTTVTNLQNGTTSFSLDLYEDGVKIGTIVNQVMIGVVNVLVNMVGVESGSAELGSVTVEVGQTASTNAVAARVMLASNGTMSAILDGGLGILSTGEVVACISTLGSNGCIMLRANGELIVVV